MLTQDDENSVYKRKIIDIEKLDYSLDSLKHIDDCLEIIRNDPLEGFDFLRFVPRHGAYVGEVIKRNSKKEYHWVEHKEAEKFRARQKPLKIRYQRQGYYGVTMR